jgi:hypothetical protein
MTRLLIITSLFIPKFKKLVEEEGHSPRQVFNVDGACLSSTTQSLYIWTSTNTMYHDNTY